MPDDLQQLADRAGVPRAVAEHFGPLLALLRATMEDGAGPAPAPTVTPSELSIEPGRLYTAAEANGLLRLGGETGRMTIYEIPEADLPRCKVGPARGALRFLGADLLAYARGLPLSDVQDLVDGARDELRQRLARPTAVAGAVGTRRDRRRIV